MSKNIQILKKQDQPRAAQSARFKIMQTVLYLCLGGVYF
jgi:hypothetical protein